MIELRQSNKDLGMLEYEMLQGIGTSENGFMNEVYGMTFEEYKKWLIVQDDYHLGKNLPEGWIPSTTYFLYDNDVPVGIGRVRHETSEYLQKVVGAGEIGYGISKNYRGKGYGNILFKEILKKCKDFGYEKITLFPHKDNLATIKIMLKNGGKIIGKFKEEKVIIEIPTKESKMRIILNGGGSAGSMDSADIVYCPPEIEGEALDTSFKRYRKGLGLTNINIYPHWNESLIEEEYLDGKNIFRDIMLEDSKTTPFIAYDDGTYILQIDGKAELFGNAYKFEDGNYHPIKEINNKSIDFCK